MTPGDLPLTLWRGTTFGPVEVTCLDGAGAAVDLTGWSAFAEVRAAAGKHRVLDLQPAILTGIDGKVTIPGFTDEQTLNMPHGDYVWDLVLERPTGERLGPVLAGSFTIQSAVTRG
jgi:hypothetical protein